MYCTVLHCSILHCIELYGTVLYCIALYCIALHYIALYCIALHCIVLYCIILHCVALYCIALHCIVLYCIVLNRSRQVAMCQRRRSVYNFPQVHPSDKSSICIVTIHSRMKRDTLSLCWNRTQSCVHLITNITYEIVLEGRVCPTTHRACRKRRLSSLGPPPQCEGVKISPPPPPPPPPPPLGPPLSRWCTADAEMKGPRGGNPGLSKVTSF